MLQKRSRAA